MLFNRTKMKRALCTILIVLAAGLTQAQTNINCQTIDVRTRGTFRGFTYMYDSLFFKPDNSNIPWYNTSGPLDWVFTSEVGTGKFVRVSLATLGDSISPMLGSYWVLSVDTLKSTGANFLFMNKPVFTDVQLFSNTNTSLGMSAMGSTLAHSAGSTGWNNTAIGNLACSSLVEGYNNTSVGYRAGAALATHWDNTFVGANAGQSVTAIQNTGIGSQAINDHTGAQNTAVGFEAMGDGTGSANGNTAIGALSLKDLTTGYYNAALGNSSAAATTIGIENTAVGYYALTSNVANSGSTAIGYYSMRYADDRAASRVTYNTAVGAYSLHGSATAVNNTGRYNSVLGYQTGYANTSGYNNVFLGYQAGYTNTSGYKNIAIGYQAQNNNTSAYGNVAIGDEAMDFCNGSTNVAIGYNAMSMASGTRAHTRNIGIGTDALTMTSALANNTDNIAIGMSTGQSLGNNSNQVQSGNIFIGTETGLGCASASTAKADYNTGLGYHALYRLGQSSGKTPLKNIAIGYYAMADASAASYINGDENISIGSLTLGKMTDGDYNIAIGDSAGFALTTGDANVLLGKGAGAALTTESNRLVIDNHSSTKPFIDGRLDTDSLRLNADVAFVKDLWYEDTYWLDASTSAMALAPGGAAPSLRTFVGAIKQYGYAPSGTNDSQYGQAQINHDYKLGTDLHSHFHWSLETAPAAGDTIVFSLEYSWADLDEAFPATTTDTIKVGLDGLAAKYHYISEIGTLTGAGGDNVSSSVVFYITRLASHPSDTYDGVNDYVFVLDVDFHKEINSPGSRGEYGK